MAVAALAVGPFVYRSLLPGSPAGPAAGCSFLVITGGLVALLAAAAIWLLRRRRRSREPELDKRLWEAALGGKDEPPGDSVRRSG